MPFRIEHDTVKREGFGNYEYCIYEGDKMIARYWHDYRGDDHGIEFFDGSKESWPVGQMTDFLKGGGPEPLILSDRAVDYLKQNKP